MTADILDRLRAATEGTTPGPWETSCKPWPTQIGCCPLVGNPRSAHHEMYNVAAANTDEDIRFIADARSLIPECRDTIAALREELRAFLSVWAVTYARDFGFPDGHLHPQHFDRMAELGCRMDDFTRAEV